MRKLMLSLSLLVSLIVAGFALAYPFEGEPYRFANESSGSTTIGAADDLVVTLEIRTRDGRFVGSIEVTDLAAALSQADAIAGEQIETCRAVN